MITMEGWSKIMYNHMDAIHPYICIYFLFLIVIGSFFLLNLILAVIMRSFVENDEREKQKLKEKKLKELDSKRKLLQKMQQEANERKRLFRKLFKRSRSEEPRTCPGATFQKLLQSLVTESDSSLEVHPHNPRGHETSNALY